MRKMLISLAAVVLPLLGASVAQADGNGPGSPTTTPNQAMVVGTITSVDPTHGSFVADAFVVPPFDGGQDFDGNDGGSNGSAGGNGPAGGNGFGDSPSFGGFGFAPGGSGSFGADYRTHSTTTSSTTTPTTSPTEPTATSVTITTNSSTTVSRGKQTATVSDLAVGDHFRALFTGSPTDSITTLVANPALSIDAQPAPTHHQPYAFVGTVKSTDTTAGTVTVTVSGALPSGLVTTGNDATFTVGSSTLVVGGSSTSGFAAGSLTSVSPGDIVAGGLIGSAGMTAAQVEARPLMLLLDFPQGTSSTTTASTMHAKAAALQRAEQLLGIKSSTKTTTKTTTNKTHKKHTSKHSKKK